jgi:hypothetical protein
LLFLFSTKILRRSREVVWGMRQRVVQYLPNWRQVSSHSLILSFSHFHSLIVASYNKIFDLIWFDFKHAFPFSRSLGRFVGWTLLLIRYYHPKNIIKNVLSGSNLNPISNNEKKSTKWFDE